MTSGTAPVHEDGLIGSDLHRFGILASDVLDGDELLELLRYSASRLSAHNASHHDVLLASRHFIQRNALQVQFKVHAELTSLSAS